MKSWMVAIAVVLLCARPSHACKKNHESPFELFDDPETVTVALVNVRKTPSGSPTSIVAGDVELSVTRVIKGQQTKIIIAKESETSCRARYIIGSDAVVLLRADGFTNGAHEGHLRDVAWAKVLESWAQATDAKGKVAVLVDAIASGNGGIAAEAIGFLLDQPALLDVVNAEQTKKIAATAKKLPKEPDIVMLLVRLRETSAASRANVALWARMARGVLAAKDIALETDTNKLADIVAKKTKDEDPRRVAAMERCERLHGKSLAPFFRYFGGAGSEASWKDLADLCRS